MRGEVQTQSSANRQELVGTYRLAKHVHMCRTDDHFVVLDMRKNRYLGIAHAHAALLAARVQNWPLPVAGMDAAFSIDAEANQLFNHMLAEGLLTTDPCEGHDALRSQSVQPRVSLIDGFLNPKTKTRLIDILHATKAYRLARAAVRFHRLQEFLGRVQARKQKPRQADAGDLNDMRETISVFAKCRVFLYSIEGACLLDSLAVVDFLSRRGMFPSFVIGVRTRPFAAHAWVQSGDYVINDTPEFVRKFTPIFST